MKSCLIPGAWLATLASCPLAAVRPIFICFLAELEARPLAFSYQLSLFSVWREQDKMKEGGK